MDSADETLREGSADRTHPRGAAQGTKLLPSAAGSSKRPIWRVMPCIPLLILAGSPAPPAPGRARLCLGPSFSALPGHETERDCHFATPEEVRAGGDTPVEQRWGLNKEQPFQWRVCGLWFVLVLWVFFFFPNCLTHRSL